LSARGGRYHHGDLRAALIDIAVELIDERGVREFSMAEASRRVGVAVSAPYAHFADRDDLLAAVAVHAFERFTAELLPEVDRVADPAQRLAALAAAYVRFAGMQRPLFEAAFGAGVDKDQHPEVKAAEAPLDRVFTDCIRELANGAADPDELAAAVEAVAHGHAMLLLDEGSAGDRDATERAAERASRATLALVASRRLLDQPAR
jgi:AcrR family transcriptional regulator